MLNWALDNEGPCSWGVLTDMEKTGELNPQEKQFLEFNERMGVTAGYTISFGSATSRSKGAIALTAKRGITQEEVDQMWAEHGEDIHLMNKVAHLKILSLPHSTPSRRLTKRQREALEWAGDGKTMHDTAQLMQVSQGAVEKHLRLAREKLDVGTTAQAILKAALSNQIWR